MVGLIAPKLNQQHTQPTLLMNALNTGISAPAPPSPPGEELEIVFRPHHAYAGGI